VLDAERHHVVKPTLSCSHFGSHAFSKNAFAGTILVDHGATCSMHLGHASEFKFVLAEAAPAVAVIEDLFGRCNSGVVKRCLKTPQEEERLDESI
jgi:hypothetical protein